MQNHFALKQYQQVAVASKLAAASPHGMVAMLLDGILKNLSVAKGAMERDDVPLKGEMISKTIRIIDNLRASLDRDKGGELADNLSSLYSYMERRLLSANRHSDRGIIDEVSGLVHQIKSAWDAIPETAKGTREN